MKILMQLVIARVNHRPHLGGLMLSLAVCGLLGQGCSTAKDRSSPQHSGLPQQSVASRQPDKPLEPDASEQALSPSAVAADSVMTDGNAPAEGTAFIGVRETGTLASSRLVETSGLAASRRKADVLWAINDSGQPHELYALSTTGGDLGYWEVDARNRDWEDLGSLQHNGEHYLLIADIGDNLRQYDEYAIHIVPEPTLDGRAKGVLQPIASIRFRYEDGSHNAEALAAVGDTIYLITKNDGSSRKEANLYSLPFTLDSGSNLLVARKMASLAPLSASLESRLAAAVAGVNLNAITALDFAVDGTFAVVLTYREVRRYDRNPEQSWADALSGTGRRLHAHSLGQSEALAVSPNRMIWFTSEGRYAPVIGLGLAPDA